MQDSLHESHQNVKHHLVRFMNDVDARFMNGSSMHNERILWVSCMYPVSLMHVSCRSHACILSVSCMYPVGLMHVSCRSHEAQLWYIPMIPWLDACVCGSYCRFYVGQRPSLMVADLDMVKQILVKEFDNFMDRPVSDHVTLVGGHVT